MILTVSYDRNCSRFPNVKFNVVLCVSSFQFGNFPAFDGMRMFPDMRSFSQNYRCFSVSMLPGNERNDVENGGKSS